MPVLFSDQLKEWRWQDWGLVFFFPLGGGISVIFEGIMAGKALCWAVMELMVKVSSG